MTSLRIRLITHYNTVIIILCMWTQVHLDYGLQLVVFVVVAVVVGCSIEVKDCSIKVKDCFIRINHPVHDCFIRVGDCSIRLYQSFFTVFMLALFQWCFKIFSRFQCKKKYQLFLEIILLFWKIPQFFLPPIIPKIMLA